MSEPQSVTRWLKQLAQGDGDAAARLWERYGSALRRLARSRYRRTLEIAHNEEDLAQCVFVDLWNVAVTGRLDTVQNRNELWYVLLTITRFKALGRVDHQTARKRQGQVHSIDAYVDDSMAGAPSALASKDPPPDLAVMMEDEHSRLMQKLRDDLLRQVAHLRLVGLTNEEIAAELGVSTRTVIRKVKLIRELWSRELPR